MFNKLTAHGKNWSVKTAILALVILGLVILTSKVFSIVKSFNQPITTSLINSKNYSLDNKSTVNVLFVTNPTKVPQNLSLVSYHPKEKKAVILHISDKTFLELPKGYGSWPVGSIYRLGQEQQPQIGAYLLKLSAAKLMGLPVDGVVVFDKTADINAEDLISSWSSNPFGSYLTLGSIKSDLTKSEAISLFNSLAGVRADRLEVLDLERSNITESHLLPDSSRVLGVDTIRLDLFVREKMADEDFVNEGLSIGVFNGTDHPLLTTEVVRTITNMGGNVIIVGNTESKIGKSLVTLGENVEADVQNSYTSNRLKQLYAPDCLANICSMDDPKINSSRAQVNIILGEDYFKKWKDR